MMLPEPSDHLRVVAIVEAYAGVGARGGNALELVSGKPRLWHVLHNLGRSQFVERVAVVTSTDSADQAVVAFALDHDAVAVRGIDDDLLPRFARIAELLDADIVVRVTPRAAPVDPEFIDRLAAMLIEQGGDYFTEQDALRGIHVFTRRALDKLMMDAQDDPVARARVSDYFLLHPDFARGVSSALSGSAAGGELHVQGDVAFVDTMHARMSARDGEATLDDLLALKDRDPRAHRSRPAKVGGEVLALIRCDGGGRHGYGRVMRMLALARALKERHGIAASFAVNGTCEALGPINHAGFDAALVESARDHAVLSDAIALHRPLMLILDQGEGLTRTGLADLSVRVPVTAVIEDCSERRLAADFAYYPPFPQVEALDWTGSQCSPRIGWEWALLGLGQTEAPRRSALPRPTLLVTMGASDPQDLTLPVAKMLAELAPVFRARFVIGPGMKNGAAVAQNIVQLAPHFETLEGAYDLATEYAASDLALTALGVSALELAASGVPALYLCLTEDQKLASTAFEQAGMGKSLGLVSQVQGGQVGQAVWRLLGDTQRRRRMRAAGLATIDDEGARRVAADLAAALGERSAIGTKRAAR